MIIVRFKNVSSRIKTVIPNEKLYLIHLKILFFKIFVNLKTFKILIITLHHLSRSYMSLLDKKGLKKRIQNKYVLYTIELYPLNVSFKVF